MSYHRAMCQIQCISHYWNTITLIVCWWYRLGLFAKFPSMGKEKGEGIRWILQLFWPTFHMSVKYAYHAFVVKKEEERKSVFSWVYYFQWKAKIGAHCEIIGVCAHSNEVAMLGLRRPMFCVTLGYLPNKMIQNMCLGKGGRGKAQF